MSLELNLKFRLADISDLDFIIELLADDSLGQTREVISPTSRNSYARAFENINSDPGQELTVIEDESGKIIACFQISYIQYLTHQGGMRAQLEGLRVHRNYRGKGIGKQIINYAREKAIAKGCIILQLTTDNQRPGAIRFYESQGFVATHHGMKMKL